MQVSSLSNKSMIAEVPMCLIMRSTKSCFLFKKSTIWKLKGKLIFVSRSLHIKLHQTLLISLSYQTDRIDENFLNTSTTKRLPYKTG